MTSILRLSDTSHLREEDVRGVLQHLRALRCVEVTGFSNVGKSEFLRLLADPRVWVQELGAEGAGFLAVYIDCNRMVEMTDQGFYELVLRCLQESSPDLAQNEEITRAYEVLVAPASEFQIPLSFNQGLDAALAAAQRQLILLLDEFDEPFQQIDSRVFLNLRAKKDRYGDRLAYVTATVHPLAVLRPGDHCGEFYELFAHQPWRLAPMPQADVARWLLNPKGAGSDLFTQEDAEFVYLWSGGHPGMMPRVRRRLEDALAGESDPDQRWSARRKLAASLPQDPVLIQENEKIWRQCTEEEREALTALFAGQDPDPATLDRLQERAILTKRDGELRAFARLFAVFVQNRAPVRQEEEASSARVWVDGDSGQVFVDGHPVETLTRLEYRLMTLLFENAGAIVDKYRLVAEVWGEEYIDSVDDARVEKLVSRLRQKVEPDPSAPQLIKTVRGRGYRLEMK